MTTPVSVIVPSWGGTRDIPGLLARLDALRREHGLELEVLVLEGPAGSTDAAAPAALEDLSWWRMVPCDEERSPGAAVLRALRQAAHPVLVVMSGDLSHPPEAIPNMVLALEAGHDFVFGSRYVKDGSTDDDRGVLRWLADQLSALLVRPLTSAKDPLSGFFALRHAELADEAILKPVGRSIGLELIVKCGMENVGEVPIHFTTPRGGEPGARQRRKRLLLRHLRRLYVHKFGVWSDLAHFLAVGASGAVVNLACLTALIAVDVPDSIAIALAIAVSMFTNFLLNRRFTFDHARHEPFFRQLAGFVAACSLGAIVNFAVTALAHDHVIPTAPVQVSAMLGIAAGTGINFIVNRYVVFRAKHIRAKR